MELQMTPNMLRGTKVTRVAADVFDGTQKALYTVSGGKVLITCLIGEVTVATIDAGASNMSFVTNPTVGTDAAMCAVLDINADQLGTIYSCPFDVGVAVQGGLGGGAYLSDKGWIAAEGTIDLLTVADVGTGGALGYFELWFIPLDDGANVVAA
jgi:hypothetical protein